PAAPRAEGGRHGSIQDVAGVDAGAKAVFKTAHDIEWPWHVRHQAVFQKHTDNGVSKTVNLPHDAVPDDVAGGSLVGGGGGRAAGSACSPAGGEGAAGPPRGGGGRAAPPPTPSLQPSAWSSRGRT